MAAKKPFSIADYVQPDDVSNLDHPIESAKVIEIPIDDICCNDKNFYDTSNIDELVKSIALNGLLEPVIVKPDVCDPQFRNGKQFYRLISGHRRFLSFKRLNEEEPEKWATIPAIVREPANEVVEELMLIEANRATRVLSSADTLRQAERYKALLVELKEQGVEIPGRLRDVVAEAMQISASRLARLEVIRKGLIPEYAAEYAENKINESAAYELARLLPAHQHQLHGNVKITGYPTSMIPALDEKLNIYFGPGLKCDRNRDTRTQTPGYCDHGAEMWNVSKKKNLWGMCQGCCANCSDRRTCKSVCPRVAPDVQEQQAEAAKQRALDECRQAERDDLVEKFWSREQAAREAAGITPDVAYARLTEICKIRGVMTVDSAEDLIEQENGCAISPENDDSFWRDDETPFDTDAVKIYADLYKCSVDYFLCRTDNPSGSACAPTTRWRLESEKPPEGAHLIAKVGSWTDVHIQELSYQNGKYYYFEGEEFTNSVRRWIPYPEEPRDE